MLEQKPKFGPIQYGAGSTIIRQGDTPDQFYIITSGVVDVVRQHEDGSEESIDRLGVGEYFGEIGLVRRIKRIATIRALTDVELIAMDQQAFTNWLNRSQMIRDEIEEVIQERIGIESRPEPVDVGQRETTPPREKMAAARKRSHEADFSMDSNTHFFPARTDIIRQGDIADTFYIILEGEVEVVKQQVDGDEQFIARLAEGNYFGEIGLMEGRERIATVRSVTDVRVVAFDRETFNGWLADSPSSKTELEETAERRRKDTGRLTMPPGDPPDKEA